jgi:hypothetical protein
MTNGTHMSLARRSAIIQKNHDELKMCSYGNALSVKTLACILLFSIITDRLINPAALISRRQILSYTQHGEGKSR